MYVFDIYAFIIIVFAYSERVCIGRSFIFLGGGEGAYIIYVYLTVQQLNIERIRTVIVMLSSFID